MMLKYFSHFSETKKVRVRSGAKVQDEGIDALVLGIKQLVRHPGYDPSKIASGRLRRYLPSERGREWRGETLLRQQYAANQIDQSTLTYLVANVQTELQMAHERSAC